MRTIAVMSVAFLACLVGPVWPERPVHQGVVRISVGAPPSSPDTSRAPQQRRSVGMMWVYYIPLAKHLPVGVSPSTIYNSANLAYTVRRKETQNALLGLLSDRLIGGQFNQSQTRLRIDLGRGKSVVVDWNGVVRWDGRQYYLKPRAYLSLDYLVRELGANTPAAYVLRSGDYGDAKAWHPKE